MIIAIIIEKKKRSNNMNIFQRDFCKEKSNCLENFNKKKLVYIICLCSYDV